MVSACCYRTKLDSWLKSLIPVVKPLIIPLIVPAHQDVSKQPHWGNTDL